MGQIVCLKTDGSFVVLGTVNSTAQVSSVSRCFANINLQILTQALRFVTNLNHHTTTSTQPSTDMSNHGCSAHLQRAHIHCPITALDFFQPSNSDGPSKHYVLSGEDTHLKIRDASTSRLCASVQVFLAQPIHGINFIAAGADILVWGGPWVAVIPGSRISDVLDKHQHQHDGTAAPPLLVLSREEVLCAPDWIYHVSLSPTMPALGAAITAHNEVIPLHITRRPENEGCVLRWGRVKAPPSRPILYSAQVRWTGDGDDNEVLVAAGTAFGEIIVWRCRLLEGETDADDVEVLYVFSGHEGSIFGVEISPAILVGVNPRRTARLLASCSDDRTIRVWDVSDSIESRGRLPNGGKREEEKKTSFFTAARETGFGENPLSELEASASQVSTRPLAMAMGHVSRIWNVRFAPPRPGIPVERMTLYSFGEDASALRWRLDLDGPGIVARLDGRNDGCARPIASLTQEAAIHRHCGKHIWSSALLAPVPPSGKILVATGGSDGGINIVEEMASPAEDDRFVMLDISGSEVVHRFSVGMTAQKISSDSATIEEPATLTTSAKRKNAVTAEDSFLMYALLSHDSVIATTQTGRIFNGRINGSEIFWSEVPLLKPVQNDLRRYHVVRSVGMGTALFGSISGQLYVYSSESIRQLYKMPAKIADIFPLPVEALSELGIQQRSSTSPLKPIIVSTMGSSQVRLLVLDPTSSDAPLQQEHLIELEKGFIATAAGYCQGHLIFGSRIGALLMYKPNTDGQASFERIARIERPFTKDAVACIISLPPKADLPSPYFLTTSRDGRYRIYEITTSSTTNDTTIHLRHEALPPLGPIIESAFFTPTTDSTSPELILAGFRSRSFIVWNETRQLELANVECGGGHRSFTYRVEPSRPDRVSFIWTKASRTCVYSQAGLSQCLLKSGGHGREIKAVGACWATGLLATGAEDTTVRIWRYRSGSSGQHGGRNLECLAVVEKHTTGIQCLKWAGEHYLLSSSGNEELFIWRVTKLDESDYEGIAVVCEGVYPDKTRDGDLRIMGFDVEALSREASGEEDEDEEVLCLSLVLSNSTLKTYRYSKTAGFALSAEGRYTGACLLQIRHLKIASDPAAQTYHVLTTSTDGHLALWKTSTGSSGGPQTATAAAAEYTLVEVLRLHQSSIKALDLRPAAAAAAAAAPGQPNTSIGGNQPPTPSSYSLLTGGDDNAVGHVRVDWDAVGGHFRVSSRSLANGAHAAAVTGLCITGLDRTAEGYAIRLCTASNDERVKSWRVDVAAAGGNVLRVALVENRYSAIADAGDLENLDGGEGIVVVGIGMEFWRV